MTPILLFLDGTSPHMYIEVVSTALKHNIIMVLIPSHKFLHTGWKIRFNLINFLDSLTTNLLELSISASFLFGIASYVPCSLVHSFDNFHPFVVNKIIIYLFFWDVF